MKNIRIQKIYYSYIEVADRLIYVADIKDDLDEKYIYEQCYAEDYLDA